MGEETGNSIILSDQIYCMDCMELVSQMPDGYVSMILTDPPYGISYQNNFTNSRHQVLDGDEGIDYELFAHESYRILKDNAHAYFFTRFDCYPYHYECLRQAGFAIKNCMVVEKGTVGGIGDLKGSFANNAEWIIFCQKGRKLFNHTTLLQNRKRQERNFMQAENQVRSTRQGLMPAGSALNIPKQLIIPSGRNRTGYTTLQLKMWSSFHG